MPLSKKLIAVGTVVAVVGGCLALGLRLGAEPPAAPPQPAPTDKTTPWKPPPAVVGKTFAIAPVTTDLQRRLIVGSGPKSAVMVLVDGGALYKDFQTIDVEAFNLKNLRAGLKSFQPEKGRSVAHIRVHYPARNPDKSRNETVSDGMEVISYTLEGSARALGYVPTGTSSSHGYVSAADNDKFSFEEFIGPLKDEKGAEEAEDGLGDERVRAYPVRTPLSRVLTQSLGIGGFEPAGGVVDVRPLLECRADDWVPVEVDKSVKAAIGKLKLPKGERLTFFMNVPRKNQDESERAGVRILTKCKQWAADSGLEYGSYTW